MNTAEKQAQADRDFLAAMSIMMQKVIKQVIVNRVCSVVSIIMIKEDINQDIANRESSAATTTTTSTAKNQATATPAGSAITSIRNKNN